MYFYKDEYLEVSGDAESEFENRTSKFKMADPI